MKLKGILLLLLLVAVTAGVVLAIVYLRPKECDKVEVRLAYTGPDTLLTDGEVLGILKSKGIVLEGSAPGKLRRSQIEEALRSNVWFDTLLNLTPMGTALMMEVRVKSPFIAVFPNGGLPYFIGNNGEILPDNSRVSSTLFVLNGNITTPYTPHKNVRDVKDTSLYEAYLIARAIAADTLLSGQLTQLYVNDNSEIEAYNTLDRHSVLIGHADNIGKKLEQLHIVYDEALIYLPAGMYSQVDVRFQNRVFATKKN